MKQFLQPEENTPPAENLSPLAQPDAANGETTVPAQEEVTEIERLQTRLSEESRQHRRVVNRQITTVVGLGVLAGIATLLGVRDPGLLPYVITFLLFTVTVFLLTIDYSPKRRQHLRQRKRMTDQLAASPEGRNDLRSIGPFIDAWGGAYGTGDRQTREEAAEALIDLLPQLKASDSHLLDATHRDMLCQLLNIRVENPLYKDVSELFRPSRNTAVDLRVATLRAFEQVGDSKALPVVERLAKEEVKSPGEKLIRDVARACLPALQQRVDQERQSKTLLRAADTTMSESDTLVRPAGSQTVAETLLRPDPEERR